MEFRQDLLRGPELGQKRTVTRDVKAMVRNALHKAHEKQPALSTNPDDYLIANFSIGLEGMGHWETECEISRLKFLGKPVIHNTHRTR